MTIKFGQPIVKKSKKDGHTYATSEVVVDGIKVGYVTRHSEVLFGVGLPRPQGKGLVWKQFASRDEVRGYLKTNGEKALAAAIAAQPEAAQASFGL